MRTFLSRLFRILCCFLAVVSLVCVALSALEFIGALSALGFVETAVAWVDPLLSNVLSLPIATTPAGGLLRTDFLSYAVIFACAEWPLSRLADRLGAPHARLGAD